MTDGPKPRPPFDPRNAAAAIWRELKAIREALERLAPPALVVDLDTPRGDPKVRAIPKAWKGSTHYKGGPFSACPPELLDELASMLEYFSSEATDPKKKKWDALDAARARGWAARLRDGWTKPTTASVQTTTSSSTGPPRVVVPSAPLPKVAHVTHPSAMNEPAPFEDTAALDELPSTDDDELDNPDLGP